MGRGRVLAAGAGATVAVVVIAGGALVATGMLGAGAAPAQAGPAPRYVDETGSSGITQTYDGGAAYFEGGGIAAFDCSGDGLPELYIPGGVNPSILYRNVSTSGGALRFEADPGAIDDALDSTGAQGAYPLDVDGDFTTDLALLTVDGAHVLRGMGDCRFELADETLGFDGGDGWTTAFSATWEGANFLPTLAVGTYQVLDEDGDPTFDCDTSRLVRPASRTGNTYGAPIELTPGYCTLAMLFSDWDGSGRGDLRVTNDRHYYVDGMDQLWRVAPDEPPAAYTADDGWVSLQIWGMGIASRDVTGDGLPEYYLTSQGDNKLQTLTTGPEQPTYRDIALKRGVTAAAPFTGGDVLPSTAWHPEFGDVNNDGFVDLFVSKGNVSADPSFAQKDPSNLLLGQPDGTFVEAAEAAGIVSFDRGRGATLADLNGDGLRDLVLVNLGAPVRIWRNVGSGTVEAPAPLGHWLAVELVQAGTNPDAIGAWIEVRTGDAVQRHEVVVGGGHLGGTLAPIHFGLGPATKADVRVRWPDGTTSDWRSVPADTIANVSHAPN
jgi:hypothetical protein